MITIWEKAYPKAATGALVVVGATLVFAVGCDIFSPPPPKPPEPILEMTSPELVCYRIEQAYNQADINLYKSALASNFVFYFNPNDIGQVVNGYTIPESWEYNTDWNSTNNMFSLAYSIELHIQEIPEPSGTGNTYKADNRSIYLLLMIDELNGYRTDKGYCDFQFEKYLNENNEERWRLVKWWDHTSAS